MSGLDGLGWPNPKDEPKPKKTMNSQLEIKLAPTPESDAMECFDAMCDPDRVVEADFARKLERERDVAQKAMGDARDILLDAMPDANAPTKILAEMIVAERDILRKHISIMDISHKTANDEYFELAAENEKLERERDEAQERADTMFAKHVDILDQTRNERDELIRAGRVLKTAKGRFHTEQAATNLFNLLP